MLAIMQNMTPDLAQSSFSAIQKQARRELFRSPLLVRLLVIGAIAYGLTIAIDSFIPLLVLGKDYPLAWKLFLLVVCFLGPEAVGALRVALATRHSTAATPAPEPDLEKPRQALQPKSARRLAYLLNGAVGASTGLTFLTYPLLVGKKGEEFLSSSTFNHVEIGAVAVLFCFILELPLETFGGAVAENFGTRASMVASFSLRAAFPLLLLVAAGLAESGPYVFFLSAAFALFIFALGFTLYTGNYEEWLVRQCGDKQEQTWVFGWSEVVYLSTLLGGAALGVLTWDGLYPVVYVGSAALCAATAVACLRIRDESMRENDGVAADQDGDDEQQETEEEPVEISRIRIGAVVFGALSTLFVLFWLVKDTAELVLLAILLIVARITYGHLIPQLKAAAADIAERETEVPKTALSFGERWKKAGVISVLGFILLGNFFFDGLIEEQSDVIYTALGLVGLVLAVISLVLLKIQPGDSSPDRSAETPQTRQEAHDG